MSALLSVTGLARRFGGVVAVDGVSLSITRGEVHGLIGPNGAGKTTVFNLISGHLLPSAGQILFGSEDVTRAPPERRARHGIRRTFQNLKLFREMTALENVMVGLHASTRSEIFSALLRTPGQRREEERIREESREALGIVGLAAAAETIAGSLPYGHQRLLEIARAIVARPKLLLLDEPAAGMNGAEGARLVELIRRIRDLGITIMMVEHHMEVVMPTCDRITVLNYGRLLASGTPAEIRRHPEVIRAYLGQGSSRRRPPSSQAEAQAHAAG
jgi:branched-chain amino acid transport system ATP-binding protein